MRGWTVATIAVLLVAGFACTRKHDLSPEERQRARNGEVASFANANGASVVPDIRESGVTLDWQKALRGPNKTFAFRGSMDDIFEKDGKYFLKVIDIDNKLLWVIQCSEAEAEEVRGQHDKTLESLLVADVAEIHSVSSEDSTTEVTGTLRKFQPSKAPL
jgi:hypothetical protein